MNGYAPEYVHKQRINLLPSETGSTPNVRFFYVLESIVMRRFTHDDVPFWRYFSVKG